MFNGKLIKVVRQKVDLLDEKLVLPKGESIKEMKMRILRFVKLLKEKKPVLIVTHEGCLRTILAEKYKVKFSLVKCNTSSEKIYIWDIVN